jgi:hypothetical protein
MQRKKVRCEGLGFEAQMCRDLLVREESEAVLEWVRFPEHVREKDLGLYANFLHTGYLNPEAVQAIGSILAVADVLMQKKICEVLISHLKMLEMSIEDCIGMVKVAEKLSCETCRKLALAMIELISKNTKISLKGAKKVLRKLYEACEVSGVDDEVKEQILQAMINLTKKTYLELFDEEVNRLEQKKIMPEAEFVWKLNLEDIENTLNSDSFELKTCNLQLSIEIVHENMLVNLTGTESISTVFRGLIIYQGVSEHFFYIPGSASQLSKTSIKTQTTSIKIILRAESFLYALLLKAKTEFNNSIVAQISFSSLKLLISFLSPSVPDERILELIAKYCESVPNPEPEAMTLLNWENKDDHFYVLMSKKYPALQKIAPFAELITKIKSHKSMQQESVPSSTNGEAIYIDEHPCPPLTPSGNPFILDISEIQTAPSSGTKKFFHKRPLSFASDFKVHSISNSLADEETICKFTRLAKYQRPSSYARSKGDKKALALIQELRRKLEDSKIQHAKFNVLVPVYKYLMTREY